MGNERSKPPENPAKPTKLEDDDVALLSTVTFETTCKQSPVGLTEKFEPLIILNDESNHAFPVHVTGNTLERRPYSKDKDILLNDNTYNINAMFKNSTLNDVAESDEIGESTSIPHLTYKLEQEHNFTKVKNSGCLDVLPVQADVFYQSKNLHREDELHQSIKQKTELNDVSKLNWADVEEWSWNDDQATSSSNYLKQDTLSVCEYSVSHRHTQIRNCTPSSHNHLIGSLVRDLINFDNFQTDLITLSRRHGKGPSELIPLLKDNAEIFSLTVHSPTSATVKLRPKINFCSNHICSKGQKELKDICSRIHICPYHIYDACNLKGCMYGHTLRTAKNIVTFKSFYLDLLGESVLKEILRKVWEGTIYPKLCFTYHNGTCYNENCLELHLCYKHVMSLGLCPGAHTYCPFNHDICAPHCEKVLKYFTISTNETPRDLMRFLMYNLKNYESATRG